MYGERLCPTIKDPPPTGNFDPPVVVYDLDGVIWPIHEKTAKAIGRDVQDLITYRIMDNPLLSEEERKFVQYECFCNPDFFRDMPFYEGAKEILAVRELGARVVINTNSLTQGVADVKRPQILDGIPGLGEENLILNVLESKQDTHKVLPGNTVVFVDDSPHNIAESTSPFNIVPSITWNRTPDAIKMMRNHNVTWVKDLKEANALAYQYVKRYLASRSRIV